MFRYREAIGLDVSDGAAKIVFARRRGFAVHIDTVHSFPLSENPEDTAGVLKNVFEKYGWLDLPCVIGLRGESLMLRVVTCQSRDHRRIQDFIEEQMKHFSSLSNSPTVIEHIVSKNPGRLPVVTIGMARMDTVLGRIDHMNQAGINVVDLVPGPLAIYNAIAYLLPRYSLPLVCVDIGENSTQIVIGEKHTLAFARRFLMGSAFLESEDVAAAEQPDLFSTDDSYAGTEKGVLGESNFQEWLAELNGCLRFYSSRSDDSGRPPGKIVVCGMKSFRDEWVDTIKIATDIDTALVSSLPRSRNLEGDPSLIAATGFALTGLGRAEVKLSLLPESMKESLALRWQIKYWLLAGLALILGVLLVVLRINIDVNSAEDELERKRARVSRMEELENRLYELKAENRELNWQLHSLRAAVGNGRVFEAVLKAISNAKHKDDWITLIADSSSYFQEDVGSREETVTDPARERSPIPAPIDRFKKIVLEGYTSTDDLSTVRAMIEKLRESDMIAAADLLPDDKVHQRSESSDKWSGYSQTRFAIEISVVRI